MLKKIITCTLATLLAQTTYAAPDCFTFKTVKATYDGPTNYSADIKLKRTFDGRDLFISNGTKEGAEQSIEIFNSVFNMTESKDHYDETAHQDAPFSLKDSSIKGAFSAVDFENLRLCTTHYNIRVGEWSLYFFEYQLFYR